MKIIYGICGIGNGHLFRQLPILQALHQQGHQIMVFGYGTSFDYCSKLPGIETVPVAVPYYQSSFTGLDFKATADHPLNQQNFVKINCEAMDRASRSMGKPDLVITDYEPVSAQYAYAYDAPLVTIDQQSKFLVGNFAENLNGQSFKDEVMRLRMFFPKTAIRIACSFFQVAAKENVFIVPPTFSEKILQLKRAPVKNQLLVYASVQNGSPDQWIPLLQKFKTVDVHLFLPNGIEQSIENVNIYKHGNQAFHKLLATCSGLISNAGHSLLSEAMYLGIPVLALPLPLYEQQLNASIIGSNNFGMTSQNLQEYEVEQFLGNLDEYALNISKDKSVLLRRNGLDEILRLIQSGVYPQPDHPFPRDEDYLQSPVLAV